MGKILSVDEKFDPKHCDTRCKKEIANCGKCRDSFYVSKEAQRIFINNNKKVRLIMRYAQRSVFDLLDRWVKV